MPERTATIAASAGLHARPAATFVQAVNASGVPVMISLEGGVAKNAASILAVLSLGAGQGATVTLASDDEAVLDSLVTVLETADEGH